MISSSILAKEIRKAIDDNRSKNLNSVFDGKFPPTAEEIEQQELALIDQKLSGLRKFLGERTGSEVDKLYETLKIDNEPENKGD